MFVDPDDTPYDEAPPTIPDNMSVQQMDALIGTLMEKRAQAEEWKKTTSDLNKEIGRLEGQVVLALKQFDRKNYKCKLGSVSVVEKWRVNVPTTDEDKKALFKHMKERGILWRFATVNSNALTGLFMEEWDIAKEKGEGMDFKMPGVGEPKLHEQLQVRKS